MTLDSSANTLRALTDIADELGAMAASNLSVWKKLAALCLAVAHTRGLGRDYDAAWDYLDRSRMLDKIRAHTKVWKVLKSQVLATLRTDRDSNGLSISGQMRESTSREVNPAFDDACAILERCDRADKRNAKMRAGLSGQLGSDNSAISQAELAALTAIEALTKHGDKAALIRLHAVLTKCI